MIKPVTMSITVALVLLSALAFAENDGEFSEAPIDLKNIESSYGRDAVRLVFSARLCALRKAARLGLKHKSDDYETPETYAKLIDSSNRGLRELSLKPILCSSPDIHQATQCMPFLVGGTQHILVSCSYRPLMNRVRLADNEIPPVHVKIEKPDILDKIAKQMASKFGYCTISTDKSTIIFNMKIPISKEDEAISYIKENFGHIGPFNGYGDFIIRIKTKEIDSESGSQF